MSLLKLPKLPFRGENPFETVNGKPWPRPPTDYELNIYVLERLDQFREQGQRDWHLWLDFGMYFNGWTENSFQRLHRCIRKLLRDCLRSNGVYLAKSRNCSIAKSLEACVLEDPDDNTQAPWPLEELEKEIKTGFFNSHRNPDRSRRDSGSYWDSDREKARQLLLSTIPS